MTYGAISLDGAQSRLALCGMIVRGARGPFIALGVSPVIAPAGTPNAEYGHPCEP